VKLIVGIVFVLACVLGGFVLHHGQLVLLVVPTEYLIIIGCAIGAAVIANPGSVLKRMVGGVLGLLKGGGPGKKDYLDLLKMIYELLQLARKEGVLALESHVNEPHQSSIFTKYPKFSRDHHAVAFLCDTLKLFVAGVLDAHNMDELMERDLEAMHHEELEPSAAFQRMADAFPAIGIVAAVLGIILTMQSIDQGAAAVGMKVAGALVGTFLGVFLAYGFTGPISTAMESGVHANGRYYQCMRHVLTAAISGVNPPMAVEIGRRSIYTADRPSFEELEAALRELKGGGS
jgi:chemotaxis protein MotA